MKGKIKITLKRGQAGTTRDVRGTLKALGLGKRESSHILSDRPEVRGMVNKVKHLLAVEEIQG